MRTRHTYFAIVRPACRGFFDGDRVGAVHHGWWRQVGSKTYHFIDIPLGTTLHPEPVQSHIHIAWPLGGKFYATRDPGC